MEFETFMGTMNKNPSKTKQKTQQSQTRKQDLGLWECLLRIGFWMSYWSRAYAWSKILKGEEK